MILTSAFLNKRDISRLTQVELEDLDYHLQNRRAGLLHKLAQIEQDLAAIASDRNLIGSELNKRSTKR